MDILDANLNNLHDLIYNWISGLGVINEGASAITFVCLVVLLLIIYFTINYIVSLTLNKVITRLAKSTPTKFDDLLVENKVFTHLGKLIPLIVVMNLIPTFFSNFTLANSFLNKAVDVFLILVWVMFFRSIFRAVRDYLKTKPAFHDKPLDSYLQVANIFMFFIAGVILFTLLTGKSTLAFLGALGAASAVLMLIFKDTILGFVASIQVSTNDMVRIGDWIEMPKYGADGDVIEINLNTVKIQNWDKSITTVPTYYLITDSFKNWRGMYNAGGRRIKRSLNIKMSTIRYLSESELDDLSKIHLIEDFIKRRREEIESYNKDHNIDKEVKVNGRSLTNVGLFREYVKEYLINNSTINQKMTMLVRQLPPTEKGLPLELYMFTDDTAWAYYEDAISDIFDHLLAAIKYFKLEVFELPASDDIRKLNINTKE